MSFLGKEYRFVKQDNFDGFLKFVGVPDDKLPQISAFAPPMKFEKSGDSYTYTSKNPDGSPSVTTFKSGVEFDDTIGPEKMPMKNTFIVDGNTVTQKMKSEKGNAVITRDYSGDEVVLTIKVEGWDGVAKRMYKA
ncbi:fatty acid-binding protein 2-like [Anticarsia gemmatalis]|uniref:fatty acid-binding protein 2-like n=1 Tax=Anticarsia gemmatalis TaxID=129554 RepID=UPI003F7661F8